LRIPLEELHGNQEFPETRVEPEFIGSGGRGCAPNAFGTALNSVAERLVVGGFYRFRTGAFTLETQAD
ncbi:MAG: hypothetical protein ACREDS_12710, partial [Limisphaerales bacterium]